MPVIKDKDYWKEYNQKRKQKGYFQQNYLQRKGEVVKSEVVKSPQVVKNGGMVVKSEVVVKSLQPDNEVVKALSENILQPSQVVKNESLQPTAILQPKTEPIILQPPKCSRCQELENSISNFGNLCYQEQNKNKILQLTINRQNKALVEKNQKEEKLLKEIEANKETINKLQAEKQQPTQNYSNLKNHSQNNNNSLSNLYQLINKHKNFQSIQKIYSPKELKEREFLKSLLDKLWSFC